MTMLHALMDAPVSGVASSAAVLSYTDFDADFSISELRSTDSSGAFVISGFYNADRAASFVVSNLHYSDLAAAYTISGFFYADFTGSFDIQNEVEMSFTPSALRTLTVNAGKLPFTAGDGWDMVDPKKPNILKDPNATLDYSFNWAPWLADSSDAIASFSIIVTGGLVTEGSVHAGDVVSVFVSGGNPAQEVSVTCRVTTASTPPRVEDRTFFLTMEDR